MENKNKNKINIGIVGLGFGKEFIPIYQDHPNVGKIAICSRRQSVVDNIGDEFGIESDMRFTDYSEMVKSNKLDAIHVVTPISAHFQQTIAALQANKHVACTVPMAATVEECRKLVEAKMKFQKVYMMMETALYTREFLYVSEKIKKGDIGKIQFLRGSHMQDMGLEGWPEYWLGFPPMHYGTHAIGPLLTAAGSRAESVVCHGSGTISEDLTSRYGSPFSIETATFKLEDSPVCIEATRSLYEAKRQYRESFDIYGDQQSFEWEQVEKEGGVLFEGGESARRVQVPDAYSNLPESIKKYARRNITTDSGHNSFIQGAGHGGSHPHLVNEFVMAIMEDRDSAVDAFVAADITCAGLCAHESAMKGGERVVIPNFRDDYYC